MTAAPLLWHWLRLGGAVLGTGVAVKLMDDHLDGEDDRAAGVVTWAQQLGPGALPYALSSFAVAALLRVDAAVALFLGAYATGMGHDLGTTMPTGITGRWESALAFGAAIFGAGLPLALGAFALMAFIQCVDDIADLTVDRKTGARNAVIIFGAVETRLVAAGALLIAVACAPQLVVAVCGGLAVIEGIFAFVARSPHGCQTGGLS